MALRQIYRYSFPNLTASFSFVYEPIKRATLMIGADGVSLSLWEGRRLSSVEGNVDSCQNNLALMNLPGPAEGTAA